MTLHQDEDWLARELANLDPGYGDAVPLRGGRYGYPEVAAACRCEKPIDDDGTCVRCGRDTDR